MIDYNACPETLRSISSTSGRLDALACRLRTASPAIQDAMLGLVETALTVAERHAHRGDGWTHRAPETHRRHAEDHIRWHDYTDSDGLSEASHAACRLAFLLALEPNLRAPVPGRGILDGNNQPCDALEQHDTIPAPPQDDTPTRPDIPSLFPPAPR